MPSKSLHIKRCFQFLLPKEFKTKGNARFGGGGGKVYYERYENGVLTGELDIGIYGPVICLLTQQMSQQKESI